MSQSDTGIGVLSIEDDNEPGFYTPPKGTIDPRVLGYVSDGGPARDFLIRITPAQVDLPKGAPVDFTIHIKVLQDFDNQHPLIVRLLPVVGRGSASFAKPDPGLVSGKPAVKADGDQILITMKKTDEAARVIVRTEYPPDWWAGFTKVHVDVGESTPGEFTSAHSVEASVIVADRVPATWRRVV